MPGQALQTNDNGCSGVALPVQTTSLLCFVTGRLPAVRAQQDHLLLTQSALLARQPTFNCGPRPATECNTCTQTASTGITAAWT